MHFNITRRKHLYLSQIEVIAQSVVYSILRYPRFKTWLGVAINEITWKTFANFMLFLKTCLHTYYPCNMVKSQWFFAINL